MFPSSDGNITIDIHTSCQAFNFFPFNFEVDRELRMKLQNNRCHFQEISHRRERGVRRDYLKFSFSAFSAFCGELLCFFFDLTGRSPKAGKFFWPAAGLNPELVNA